jgi:DNA-binding response OmpR family regulator
MKKQKILVIDDDPDIGMMMKIMLNFKGYDVSVVTNTCAIEEEISDQQYDLICMDMLLSGNNGTDICKTLKSNSVLASIPLIMMSAHPDGSHICLCAGADDFIAKPFELTELLLKVGGLLKKVKA